MRGLADRELRVVVRVQSEEALQKLRELGFGITELETKSSRSEKGVIELGKGIGRLGTSAFIAYDRFAIAVNAVENAQIRQQLATMRLDHAIEKWGAGSREVTIAQQELDISTRGVEIAQQRMWVRVAFGVGVVIPEFIRGSKEMIKLLGHVSTANIFATLTTQGLTRARLALLAVGTFGIGAVIGLAAATAIDPGTLGLGGTPSAPAGGWNVYGDLNVYGPKSPAEAGKMLSETLAIKNARSNR